MPIRIAAVAVSILAASSAAVQAAVFSARAEWQQPPHGGSPTAVLAVTIGIDAGWHINSNTPRDPYLIPTTLRLELPSGWSAAEPAFPPHHSIRLGFSDEPVAVFEGTLTVTVPIAVGPAPWPSALEGAVRAQACDDRQCLAPAEVSFVVPVADSGGVIAAPPAPPQPREAAGGATPPAPSGGFAGRSLLLQLVIVFLSGLALNLTPCVYPLIPITIGFFSAQRSTAPARTSTLAIAYVLGMAATYSTLGVTAALTGRLFGAALQSPVVTVGIALVMLALASSMFGLWELRVPAWATRVSGGRSGVTGALVMGLVVGLVAAPCIGPFVLGLLTYVGQRQDPVLGFILFFTLALGLGMPYLVLAVSTRALERLPNSGGWMLGVRQLFGVLLVALAAYFLRPVLPAGRGALLLAAVLVGGGLYLLVVARPGHELPSVDRFMRLASAATLVAGLALWPRAATGPGAELTWQRYDTDAAAAAIASGGPVILDFYADWCLPCKELDEKTFSDARVAEALRAFTRYKVDLTASSAAVEAARARFSVAGVPTIAFFSGGTEIGAARLTGFEGPDAFLARLRSVAR